MLSSYQHSSRLGGLENALRRHLHKRSHMPGKIGYEPARIEEWRVTVTGEVRRLFWYLIARLQFEDTSAVPGPSSGGSGEGDG